MREEGRRARKGAGVYSPRAYGKRPQRMMAASGVGCAVGALAWHALPASSHVLFAAVVHLLFPGVPHTSCLGCLCPVPCGRVQEYEVVLQVGANDDEEGAAEEMQE